MRRIAKFLVVAIGIWPGLALGWDYWQGTLVAPWRVMTQDSGLWAMRFLTLGLLVTPLKILTAWQWPQALRRTLGHLAAGYSALHVFAWMRQYSFDWWFLLEESLLRLYLTIGVIAAVLIIPLAATSFDSAIRWLGGRRWRRIHLLVYPAAILAWVHYLLSRGVTPNEARWHAAVLLLAFAIRLARHPIGALKKLLSDRAAR